MEWQTSLRKKDHDVFGSVPMVFKSYGLMIKKSEICSKICNKYQIMVVYQYLISCRNK